jgi:Flp pilus assembly protein TadG
MAPLLRLLRRALRCESGAEFVEMALAFPLLLLVVLGIIDFGIMFQRYEVLTNAAREAARVAILPNSDPVADGTQRAQDYIAASLLGGSETPSVVVTGPTPVSLGGNCMSTVTVTVAYPHEFGYLSGIMSYFSGSIGSRMLTASSTMRTEVPSGPCGP